MSRPRQEQSDDLVKQAIAATRQLPLPPGPSATIASQTLAALREAARHPKTTVLQRISHVPWTSKAAVVLAMAAGLLVVYLGLSGFTGRALAFVEVVEALNKVRTATWKTTTEIKDVQNNKSDAPPVAGGSKDHGRENETARSGSFVTMKGIVAPSGSGMFLARSHERTETIWQGVRSIYIVDGEKNKTLILTPTTKVALLMEFKNLPRDRPSPLGKTFLNLRELVADAQRDSAKNVERLGAKTIDGRHAQGFRINNGANIVEIWADPKTLLPVRFESFLTTPDGQEVRTVKTDFQVDVDLDKSLFSLEVPKDYTIQPTVQLDFAKKPISNVAETLKMVAEQNNGVFPSSLTLKSIEDILQLGQQKILEKHSKDSMETVIKSQIDISMNISATFNFLNNLKPEENDWHYAGKDVKLNTPNRPVFWYRAHKASETYHVLYADLSVREVPSDEAPKVPTSEVGAKP